MWSLAPFGGGRLHVVPFFCGSRGLRSREGVRPASGYTGETGSVDLYHFPTLTQFGCFLKFQAQIFKKSRKQVLGPRPRDPPLVHQTRSECCSSQQMWRRNERSASHGGSRNNSQRLIAHVKFTPAQCRSAQHNLTKPQTRPTSDGAHQGN